MFTYVGLIQLTSEGRESLDHAPEYLEKIRHIVEAEGGILEDTFAAAFRALAKIGKLEVVKTETFPVEKVDIFFKTLV